jgi:S-adenosylmethionine:tRNA ribosyltransferase-isomerase
MIAADKPDRSAAKLLVVGPSGKMDHMDCLDLATLFQPGDLVVANDAATLPASLHGVHARSGDPIEIRLAGWRSTGDGSDPILDPSRFVAIAFGSGDYRTQTEHRPPPPTLRPGDRLHFGSLTATVGRLLDHPRLVNIRFHDDKGDILAGIARHGRPIQYAHVPEPLALRDVWTNLAADPVAFEPPSAGFGLDWTTLAAWRRRGVSVATVTHAAGISSTGDPALDRRLPFDEPYVIPDRTASLVARAASEGRRIVAIGTTVVRALESAAMGRGAIRAGRGLASGRIGPDTDLKVVGSILTGMHQPGESHFELLQAFADADTLDRALAAANDQAYRTHEFGDVMLIESNRSTFVAVLATERPRDRHVTSALDLAVDQQTPAW